MDNFKGNWITDKSFKVKNYDEFMDQFDVPQLKEAFRDVTIKFEYRKGDKDQWELVVNVEGFPEKIYPIKIGEEFQDVAVDGTPFKTLIKLEGNRMIEEQTFPQKFGKMTRTRRIEGDKMIVETVSQKCTLTEQMTRMN